MDTPRFITNTILIQAPADKVWNALTNPAETKKYMFGCETVSDWQAGSPLLWEGEWEGKKMVFVKGHIANIRPKEHLSYTVFDPNNPAMEDVPQNYLTVTYDLHAEGTGTRLTVTQGDYNKVADGERRYNESYNGGEGWNRILVKIKEQVEAE
jgi:uncharacterized protein YndB with AHSA1/START domain